ncbi:hypothetical protein IFM89_025933 [Coptis chinensis]|uniref:Clp R domain-containing protein n=1 Tax=Coptis chinensis TaxID=261450 RepID=A0A835H8Y7_9MAGN|nr:hypothetical protein IFM89_025933 [Coptis chinensis]
MPTPVSIARQCLTQEASTALDEAVSIATRRSHSQTTSLHLISSFLSSSSSSSLLRDTCTRVRSSTYPPRYQFKALELCFTSALDRLPSTTTTQVNNEDPPISNSLMAAVKRSQANQRRNPESFHIYQQQLQQQQQQQNSMNSSLSCVKVELQQLVLSILDDPIVSRVFGEAGFRSCDIKLAILRPLPPLGRFSRSRRAPVFLCNLTGGGDNELGSRNFNFPFLGFSGFNELSDGDESFKRIGEVLGRKKDRNPLLVGVCANDALQSFKEFVDRGKVGGLPVEVCGLSFICMENEIVKFVSEKGKEGLLGNKFEELDKLIGNSSGPGGVISFGDLKVFIDDDSSLDAVSYVVLQLSRLLELHRGKLWLIGAAASYEMYLKFLMKFPSIEKDWDLQLLPITSVKSPIGGFQSRPQSLMDSFVPFGGFFSTTSDLKGTLASTCQPISRCHLCNEKCEQEVSSFLNGGCTPSVADQYHGSLPSWLQKAELNGNKGLDVAKAKDDGTVLNAKVTGLQNKWNDICRRQHYCSSIAGADNYRVGSQTGSGTVGIPFLSDRKDSANTLTSSSRINSIPDKNEGGNAHPSIPMDLQKMSSTKQNSPRYSGIMGDKFSSELQVRDSKTESLRTEGLAFASAASVTTDLGLGTMYAPTMKEPKILNVQARKGFVQDSSDCSPSSVDVVKPNISNPPIQSSSCSGPDSSVQVDPNDLKSLWRFLMEKVGRQEEAIRAISETIARCRAGNERFRGTSLKGDVWLSFVGFDRVAKKRTALALAEVPCRKNIISVDLNSQDGSTHSNRVFGCQEANGYDVKFRGKMVVDYIAEEIRKKPLSVVFLENVDKADMLLQNSLSQAIKTGKFPDSRGREISITNATFVAASGLSKDNTTLLFQKACANKFSEEIVLKAQNLEIQILVGCAHEDNIMINISNVLVTSRKGTPGPAFANKRKLIGISNMMERADQPHKTPKYLDLNLPVQETETIDSDCENSESDALSENSEIWLETFLAQMDDTVVFKPFDFDALANRLLKDISATFRKVFGSECLLEIDSKVMEQILAAAWSSDRERAVEDWVEDILGRSFAEAQHKYVFTSRSVLKLVTRDVYVKEQAVGICLPSSIILN